MIRIDRNIQMPLYLQIKNQLRDLIVAEILPVGYRLPPERKLAAQLGVNRSTVLHAYDELKAEQLVGSTVGRGTAVLSPNRREKQQVKPQTVPWTQLFRLMATRTRDSLLQDTMKLLNRKELISFALGTPPEEFYPTTMLEKVQREVMAHQFCEALSMVPTEGYYVLREQISKFMSAWGANALPEDIMVLSGSQQGLQLVSKVFIEAGDIVITEEPTFFMAMHSFQEAGARLISVPMDQEGMDTRSLESILSRCRPKFIYTIPTYQNPSGLVMSLTRRRHLLDLAYTYHIPIIEDDPCSRIYFGSQGMPTLKSLDQHGYVLYLSSFTKMLFPGLRIGWLAAPPPVIRQFTHAKQLDDIHTNSWSQFVVGDFLRRGYLETHLAAMRQRYLERRDIFLALMEQYAGRNLEWVAPEGGMFLWCCLPEEITDTRRLLVKAVENGVSFMPGEAFFTEEYKQKYIRLNFAKPPLAVLEEGVKRLVMSIEATLRETKNACSHQGTETTALV